MNCSMPAPTLSSMKELWEAIGVPPECEQDSGDNQGLIGPVFHRAFQTRRCSVEISTVFESALRAERGGFQVERPGRQSSVGILGQCQMLGCHGLLHERHV